MTINSVLINNSKLKWRTINLDKWKVQLIVKGGTSTSNIKNIFNKETVDYPRLKQWLNSKSGFFGIIAESETHVIAAADRVRSFPIFYFKNDNKLIVSNDARKLQKFSGLYKKDEDSVLEFSMAGYVSGHKTMFEKMFQILPGQYLSFDKEKDNLQLDRYYLFYNNRTNKSENSLIKELDSLHDSLINGIIQRASGRPIWVPLSGGWDSRLIASKLAQLKCPNVQTFSYGTPNNYESKLAKKVASCLDLPWFQVDVSRKQFRDYFWSSNRREYFNFSDGLSSLPFVQDSHVIGWLIDKGRMPLDAIVVNGQTGDFITGGHILKEQFNDDMDKEQLVNSLLKTHYIMWKELCIDKNIGIMKDRIRKELDCFTDMETNGYMAACWEWQERQCKFVVNGQRAYEFHSLDWEMPLWMPEYMDFWTKVPWTYLKDQHLYKECLRKNGYKDVFNKVSTEVWRWPGLSIVVVPIARGIGLLFGAKNKNRIYRLAKFFGHYRFSYGAYSILQCLRTSNSVRDIDSLNILTWLKENVPSFAISLFKK